jgi:hypothetical protein
MDLRKCRKEYQRLLSKIGNLGLRMKDLPRGDIENRVLPVDLEQLASKTMTRHILVLISIKFVIHGYNHTMKLIYNQYNSFTALIYISINILSTSGITLG